MQQSPVEKDKKKKCNYWKLTVVTCDCESNRKLIEECISLSWSSERDLKTCVFSSCSKTSTFPSFTRLSLNFLFTFCIWIIECTHICSVLVRRVFITDTFFVQTNTFQTNPNFRTFSYFLLFLLFSILLSLTIFWDTWACSVCTDEWFIWSPCFLN